MKTLILVIIVATELSWTRKGIYCNNIAKIIHSATPQCPPVHVGCTHQSMPIVITLSPELRVPAPTVGGIYQEMMMYISIVMVINLY